MLSKSIVITYNLAISNDIDWEIFRECSFKIMGGEEIEGMTYEEYKLKKPWPIKKNADR
jgi:hypothetical protein|tara:strand:- start:64 stop:240 length:177 start_codon:yes stop_codon:yes gene_type:complete